MWFVTTAVLETNYQPWAMYYTVVVLMARCPLLTLLLPDQARDEYAKGGGLSARASSVDARGCSFLGNAAVAVAEASAGEKNALGVVEPCCA